MKKSYNPACLVITFNSRHHDMTSTDRYISESTIAFIYDVAWTSVIHGCMSLVAPKKGLSMEIVGKCKYTLMNVRMSEKWNLFHKWATIFSEI